MIQEEPLTAIQQEYFDAITAHLKQTGLFPTIREIMKATGRKSPAGVQHGLEQLQIKGMIERVGNPGQPRAYRLSTRQEQWIAKGDTICPKGHPVRAGATVFCVDGKLVGIWTPAHLLED